MRHTKGRVSLALSSYTDTSAFDSHCADEVVWFSYSDELLETQRALANSMKVLIGRLEDFQTACIRSFHYRPALQVQFALKIVKWVMKKRSEVSALELMDKKEVTK